MDLNVDSPSELATYLGTCSKLSSEMEEILKNTEFTSLQKIGIISECLLRMIQHYDLSLEDREFNQEDILTRGINDKK